jgi:hypothetical protein
VVWAKTATSASPGRVIQLSRSPGPLQRTRIKRLHSALHSRQRKPTRCSAEHHYAYLSIDRAFKANLARLTFGLAPTVLAEQISDWLAHLAISPGKQFELVEKWFRNIARFASYATQSLVNPHTPPCICPLPNDRRFQGEAWQRLPYNLIYQSFLLTEQWWHHATTQIDGLSQSHERSLSFTVRQLLDMASPSNFVWTNPEVAQATTEQGGRNIVEGLRNLIEDWQRATSGKAGRGPNDRPLHNRDAWYAGVRTTSWRLLIFGRSRDDQC